MSVMLIRNVQAVRAFCNVRPTVFGDTGSWHRQIIADIAVPRREAGGDRYCRGQPVGGSQGGVIWHTQGSGKRRLVALPDSWCAPEMENPTIVVITDRNDLDDPALRHLLDVPRPDPPDARAEPTAAKDLMRALSRASGGVVFTTIQKFAPEKGEAYPLLTDRRNVVVIADEAHPQPSLASKGADRRR
ncbi:MAG: DEAD/DEAH box helicase family protein [Paracoccaceae bacterium]